MRWKARWRWPWTDGVPGLAPDVTVVLTSCDRHARLERSYAARRPPASQVAYQRRQWPPTLGSNPVLRAQASPPWITWASNWARAKRTDEVWTDADEAAFLARAHRHLHLPLILALWTGQRQGDLIRLPWAAYDGSTIPLTQSKTDARVIIPVGSPLKEIMDASQRRHDLILLNSDARPWTSDGFRTSWGKACQFCGTAGPTFHDLRGTAVSRLGLAG